MVHSPSSPHKKRDRHFPGLYVHVPFCRSKCPYCDFYSTTTGSLIPLWLKGIKQECLFYQDQFPSFDSLYLGGGTPSVLNEFHLADLFEYLFTHFTFQSDAEITVEVNPDDITKEKLKQLRALQVNRISLGAQSFLDRELHILGRRHTVAQTKQAIEMIREVGFANLSIDLMYGLAGQTQRDWRHTLKHVLRYQPEHLSCYQLTIKPKSVFAKRGITTAGEKRERELFMTAATALKRHGYLHYEVSNYSRKKSFASRHNRKYWTHVPYLGLGPTAHSFRDNERWWNVSSLKNYCAQLNKNQRPVAGREMLSEEQLRLESLCLGLRTNEGIAFDWVGKNARKKNIVNQLREAHLVSVRHGKVFPTPEGFLLADSFALLLAE